MQPTVPVSYTHLDVYKRQHVDSPPPKKFRTIAFAGKVMASIFCDKNGIIHVDFLPRGVNTNSEHYCKVLQDMCNALFT